MKKKILITGGTGRFGNHLKYIATKHKLFFPTKKQFNILNVNSMLKYFEKIKPDIVIHLAGFSRPMELHEKDINRSINLNNFSVLSFLSFLIEFCTSNFNVTCCFTIMSPRWIVIPTQSKCNITITFNN